jgi:hypothetical protein
MSHYTSVQTCMTEPKFLALALADMNFAQVEVHDIAQPLIGVGGDVRTQTAEVIVRKQHIGWLSNDIGFKRTPQGRFEAIISDYDLKWYSPAWLENLVKRYAYHATKAKLAERGFDLVSEQTSAEGQIRLVLRRVG